MHRRLVISSMFEGATQDFPIDGRMNQPLTALDFLRQQSGGFIATLLRCPGLEDHLSDRLCYLMLITASQSTTLRLVRGKPFRPA